MHSIKRKVIRLTIPGRSAYLGLAILTVEILKITTLK